MSDRVLDRRRFCALLTSAAGALVLKACEGGGGTMGSVAATWTDASDAGAVQDIAVGIDWEQSADLPSLGGAPDTHEGWVVAAFVDTIIPGSHRDPTGAVGGLDVDAPAVIFDEELPSAELVPVLVTFIDAIASDAYDRNFDQLIPSERQEVVVTALEMLPEMGFAVQMVKLAAYTAPAYQELLGYPGANGGYVNDPLFTFAAPMSQPHPATVGGNFP